MSDSQNNRDSNNLQKVTDTFLEYRQLLRKIIGRIVKPHDIDDIVQETFLRTYEKTLKHDINHPKTYLYTTARNLALNHVVKKSHLLEESTSDLEPLDVYLSSETLESQMESKEKFLCFCRAVRELPPQCRRAFILKRIYGFSQKEIAAYLNISERTVEGHIAKGITRCATFLKRHGYSVSTGSNGLSKRNRVKEVK